MRVSPPTGRRHEMNCPGRNPRRGPRRKSERVSGACSTMRATRASYSTAMLGHDLVDGVARDDDHDLGVGILDHCLAAEARGGGQPRGLVEQVLLAVVGGGERVAAALHDHVAGGAGAVPAAGVLEVDAVPEQHVEDRPRLPVVLERRPRRVELDHPLGAAVLEDDANPRHVGNLASDTCRRDSGAARALRCKRDAMAIHYEKDGHIVTITIDRPEQRNSLDLEHFGQLADSWVRFRDDAGAYVAILTGVGDVYCVGADLKRFIPIVTERADRLGAGESRETVEGSRYTMAHSLVAVLRDGATLPDGTEFKLYKPVVAAINGICAAGGLEMMWNTDLRVCADTAWFQLAEPRRGLFPGGGSTVQSVRQLTWCHAMEVVLLADRISAERAYDMGLVNRVVRRDRVLAEARQLAETICLNGPLAVRACKRSAKESTFLPLKEALANEMSYSASVFMSEDAKEGIKAFKEKRPPVWRGR